MARRGSNGVAGADAVLVAERARPVARSRCVGSRTTAGFDAQGQATRTAAEQRATGSSCAGTAAPTAGSSTSTSTTSARAFATTTASSIRPACAAVEAEVIRRWGEVQSRSASTRHEFETYLWTAAGDDARRRGAGHRRRPDVDAALAPRHLVGRAAQQRRLGAVASSTPSARDPAAGCTRRRGAGAQFGLNPAPWFTRADGRDQCRRACRRRGRPASAAAPMACRGHPARHARAASASSRSSSCKHGFIDRGGRRVLTDSAAHWLGVLHFTARDSLRAVWQATRYRRDGRRTAVAVAAERDGQQHHVAGVPAPRRPRPQRQRRRHARHQRARRQRAATKLFVKAALAF